MKALSSDIADETPDELQDEQDSYVSTSDVFTAVQNIDTSSAVLPAGLPPGEVVKRGILFKRVRIFSNELTRYFLIHLRFYFY